MSPALLRFLCFVTWSAAVLGARADTLTPITVPRLTHPGAGQTVYFILTDRFANGRTDNDTGHLPGGPEDHGFDPTRISHYHGGDLAGLIARLDYIKRLGATTVWVSPPTKNKPVQAPTAGYHGYWPVDFLNIDPHFGTNEEFRQLVEQAHARGLKVYMDIITNHTADVIKFEGDRYDYRPKADAPYRDAEGRPFDEHAVAFNGLNDPAAFPALSAARSFPYVPVIPAAEANVKNPAWLNDPIYYHNRGNTTFKGEDAVHGDFVGLDDLFTEHPRVVQGFIDIFAHWMEEYGVDGFRIDTARHVNAEFWQAFGPAMRARARALGRPDFIEFGEVYNEAGDPAVLSEYSTDVPLDSTIDFGFFAAARKFVSRGESAASLAKFIAGDDYYTDHDSNVHASPTFLGNHDAGRFAYFLQQDNPAASPAEQAALAKFGHGLLFLSRGLPVVYYGDEQGMIGRGGGDMQAREDMFPSQSPDFKSASLLGTTRTGADDKFDEHHPFFLLFSQLAALRHGHAALRTGAMITHETGSPHLFAFSRLDRNELVEYVVAFNNSRDQTVTADFATSQPAGAKLTRLFAYPAADTTGATLAAGAEGRVAVALAPLQFAVWRAESPLPRPIAAPTIAFATPAANSTLAFSAEENDGQTFSNRHELRVAVASSDGVAEVTFVMQRASRPGQYEYLGTDDAPPYRIFWRPPPDLAPGEKLSFIATVSDLRGHQASTRLDGIGVNAGQTRFGTQGATVPVLTTQPLGSMNVAPGGTLTLTVAAEGTGPLEYQWLHGDREIAGATNPTLTIADVSPAHAGRYSVVVRNRAGTTVSTGTTVTVLPAGRVEKHPAFPSQFITARQVDVWLPPGYDENAAVRYPVIYMHDGQNLFDPATSYIGVAWSVDEAMLRLMAAGTTKGAIIVGVWNSPERIGEYMPQKAVDRDQIAGIAKMVSQPSLKIQSDNYLKFLVTEVKPFIDRTYRTRPEAAQTFVMGSSMGGLISAYAVCEYPEIFGGAGCVSTAWTVGAGAMIDYLAKHLPRPGAHKFYFDFGTETLDASYEVYQQKADRVMAAAGYRPDADWQTRKFPGADHSERAWRARVDLPLAFLLSNPKS